MAEYYVEREFVKMFERAGWLVRKMKWIGRHGAPDRFVAKRGRVVLVELKKRGGELQPSQAREFPRLRNAGVEVPVIDTVADAKALLAKLEAEFSDE